MPKSKQLSCKQIMEKMSTLRNNVVEIDGRANPELSIFCQNENVDHLNSRLKENGKPQPRRPPDPDV